MSKPEKWSRAWLDFQGPYRSRMDMVLASASPRRQSLLTSLGISFQVVPAGIREPGPEPGWSPEEYALNLARQKAGAVSEKKPGFLVVAADTIVVLGQDVLGKPESEDHALEMLRRLQGNTHQVITAVSLRHNIQGLEDSFACSTLVEMDCFPDEALIEYIKTSEPMDKAGAYAIQGVGAFMIRSIAGSFTNVVGLPLSEVRTRLLEIGAIEIAGNRP